MQDEQQFYNGKRGKEFYKEKHKTKIYDLKVGSRLKDILHKLRNLEFYSTRVIKLGAPGSESLMPGVF